MGTQFFAIEEADVFGSVTADQHVIRNVKIVGLMSRNPARVLGLTRDTYGDAVDYPYGYDADGLRAAIPLYEGASVYDGHLPNDIDNSGKRVFKSNSHANESLIGWLKNVRFKPGEGLFGDLHYLQSHPVSGLLAETARRNQSKFALSHEARFASVKLRNGRVVIDRIEGVDGIALINDRPGTTNGLFEDYVGADPYSAEGSMFSAMRGRRSMQPDGKYEATGSLVRALR